MGTVRPVPLSYIMVHKINKKQESLICFSAVICELVNESAETGGRDVSFKLKTVSVMRYWTWLMMCEITPTALRWTKFSIIGHSMGECDCRTGLKPLRILPFHSLSFFKFFICLWFRWKRGWVGKWGVGTAWWTCRRSPLYHLCGFHSLALCILRWWNPSCSWTPSVFYPHRRYFS